MSRKKKVYNETFSAHKFPKIIEEPNSYYSKSPSWRFSKMDNEHEKWSFLDNDVFNERNIINRLSSLETQTWGEIVGGENHFIKVSDFIGEAQNRMTELKLFYDELFSLRIDGRRRIFGILEGGVLFFLWYDREHEICPAPKKHT